MYYRHYRNEKIYRVLSRNVKVQINDEWIDAVLYENYGESLDGLKFTRIASEFDEKFLPCKISFKEEVNG